MNIERMTQLVRVLTKVSSDRRLSENFNLDSWVDGKVSDADLNMDEIEEAQSEIMGQFYPVLEAASEDPTADLILIPHNCGATACACGYAGLDPWFREQGLITTLDGDMCYTTQDADGIGRWYSSWNAIHKFFDLESDQAEYLFMPKSYPNKEGTTVHEVLARVQEFIADPTIKPEAAWKQA